jgi:hypothetical protein
MLHALVSSGLGKRHMTAHGGFAGTEVFRVVMARRDPRHVSAGLSVRLLAFGFIAIHVEPWQ